jgi:predicted  nucleic acid-binding Zn-ribbon protein
LADINIFEQIRKLVELQKIDAQIYELKRALVDKPALLNTLSQNFEEKKTGLKALEERYKTLQVERKTFESELKSKEDAIAKTNSQLSLIKTNREYTAKLTEIEHLKADKSVQEEKILGAYDRADEVKVAIDQEKAALTLQEQEYLKQKGEIEGSIRDLEARVKTLDAQRSQILPLVDKTTLTRYEKILVNKEGLAIVPVSGSSCGGCNMNVPAQVINEIKMHDKYIVCEMCARILYLEDDVK